MEYAQFTLYERNYVQIKQEEIKQEALDFALVELNELKDETRDALWLSIGEYYMLTSTAILLNMVIYGITLTMRTEKYLLELRNN